MKDRRKKWKGEDLSSEVLRVPIILSKAIRKQRRKLTAEQMAQILEAA